MEDKPGPAEQDPILLVKHAEASMQAAMLDKAVAEGKFEIASDVLHDIGNAVVGFGAYLTRIRNSQEKNNLVNLQNLAHFLKTQETPLSAALGQVKSGALVSMVDGILESQSAVHDEIRKSISEQLMLITHIQEILSIQRQYVTGQGAQDRKVTNLRSIVNDCVSMLTASMDKRAILVSLSIEVASPEIQGDRTRLMQVVLNILKNSIEAIPLDAVEKTISIRLTAKDGWLTVEIKDSGSGFDETTGRRLFERGFTTKTSGTGLGLHNCQAILESHGGSVAIASKGVGRGALTTISCKSAS
jgi:signal transduction histidine kinase